MPKYLIDVQRITSFNGIEITAKNLSSAKKKALESEHIATDIETKVSHVFKFVSPDQAIAIFDADEQELYGIDNNGYESLINYRGDLSRFYRYAIEAE